MKKLKLLLLGLASVAILIIITSLYFINDIIYSPYTKEESTFVIKPGEGFSLINARLANENLISSPRAFHHYTKFQNKLSQFKIGSYKIPKGSSMQEVLLILTEGTPLLKKVTIPEGKNMYQIAEIMESHNLVDSSEFISLCKSKEMIKLIGIDAPSVEGYLFPETYMFSPQTSAKSIITTMIKQFKIQTKNIDLESTNLSAHEVVILASIVEKETGAKWERPTIAGVYLNRLKRPMRLQADPTTIYGIWETYNGNLKRKHLLQKTPYNTYKINGLPLGPIANPSLAAIKAVLKPKEHNYLYFVSKNDGTHIFTPTYKKHKEAVEYWQKNYRNRKGKSWRDLKQ